MENQQEQNKTEDKVKMYPVHSSKIKEVGWYFDSQTKQGVLVAKFPNDSVYLYYPVANEVFGKIFSEKSPGAYFSKEIEKNKNVKYMKYNQNKLNL